MLSKVCDAVNSILQKDINALESEIQIVKRNWGYANTTEVGRTIDSLSASTDIDALDRLVTTSFVDSLRLRELNEALKSDAKQKAKETRASASRLRPLADR